MKLLTTILLLVIVAATIGGIVFKIVGTEGEAVVVVHWTTGHLTRDGLLKDMAKEFNKAGHRTGSGAKIVVEDEDGTEVASVVSGDDGTFQIELRAGAYVLVPQAPNPGSPPFADELAVEVLAAAFTAVLIH